VALNASPRRGSVWQNEQAGNRQRGPSELFGDPRCQARLRIMSTKRFLD
jgi:hypothetical protein